jgi:hypothetical protein
MCRRAQRLRHPAPDARAMATAKIGGRRGPSLTPSRDSQNSCFWPLPRAVSHREIAGVTSVKYRNSPIERTARRPVRRKRACRRASRRAFGPRRGCKRSRFASALDETLEAIVGAIIVEPPTTEHRRGLGCRLAHRTGVKEKSGRRSRADASLAAAELNAPFPLTWLARCRALPICDS